MLQEWKELASSVGQNVVSILLAQDMAIIPMLIGVGFLRGAEFSVSTLATQLGGGILLLALVVWMSFNTELRLPLGSILRRDHEMQVFGVASICLGLSFLTGLLGLSTALGAFVGGMIVGLARETEWIHRSLEPFRVVFVALFFVGVGLMVDLDFIVLYWRQVTLASRKAISSKRRIGVCRLRSSGAIPPDWSPVGRDITGLAAFDQEQGDRNGSLP